MGISNLYEVRGTTITFGPAIIPPESQYAIKRGDRIYSTFESI